MKDNLGRHANSCGCYMRDKASRAHATHGKSKTRLYRVWKAMRNRCNNKNSTSYHNYGGRGVFVCPEWQNDFTAFRAWAMRNGYDETAPHGACTLDRIDNDGPYSPENCRWVSMVDQASNKQKSRLIEHDGRSQTLSQWAREIGVPTSTLFNRLEKLGWSVEQALGGK